MISLTHTPIGISGREELARLIATGGDIFAWSLLAALVALAMVLRFYEKAPAFAISGVYGFWCLRVWISPRLMFSNSEAAYALGLLMLTSIHSTKYFAHLPFKVRNLISPIRACNTIVLIYPTRLYDMPLTAP